MKFSFSGRALFFFISLFLSSSVESSVWATPITNYQLIFFENPNFKDYAFETFRRDIGDDAKLLEYYRCDGEREFEVFRSLHAENEKRNSLRIQETAKDDVIVYREGKYFDLDGSPAEEPKSAFYRKLDLALEKIESYPSGRALLRLLEKSRYPLVITYGKWMTYDATRDGKRQSALPIATEITLAREGRISSEYPTLDQLGVGGKIVWDPESKASRMETDGEKRVAPGYISLSHEMYHAYDGIRGLLDRRFILAPERYEFAEVCEFRAMYFENRIREESGLRYAVHYGTHDFKAPGVLDANGKPILVPTPCFPAL